MYEVSTSLEVLYYHVWIDVYTLVYAQNIILSGGSAAFKDFRRRLRRDLKRIVDARLQLSLELSGGKLKVSTSNTCNTCNTCATGLFPGLVGRVWEHSCLKCMQYVL